MKFVGNIKKGGKEYPVCTIEKKDITEIERVCAGFIHGGKMQYLENILRSNALKCSDTLRSEREAAWKEAMKVKGAAGQGVYLRAPKMACPIRDANAIGPDGRGVYFRFAPSGEREETLLKTFTGPGSSGGFFMFLPAWNLENLMYFTMSVGDSKYGNPLTLKSMISIAKDVKSAVKAGINNSEIAFYKQVPFSKIAAIYISAGKSKCQSNYWDTLLGEKGYVYKTTIEISRCYSSESLFYRKYTMGGVDLNCFSRNAKSSGISVPHYPSRPSERSDAFGGTTTGESHLPPLYGNRIPSSVSKLKSSSASRPVAAEKVRLPHLQP